MKINMFFLSKEFIKRDQNRALSLAFSTITLPHAGNAACSGTGGEYLCDNPSTAGIVIGGADIAVNTAPGFSVNTPNPGESALTLLGAGTISYTDNNASVLSTTDSPSLLIKNNNTDATEQSVSTVVKGNGVFSNGLSIYNQSRADSTIFVDTTSDVTGGVKLTAKAEGASAITLNAAGLEGHIQVDNNSSKNAQTTVAVAGDIINSGDSIINNDCTETGCKNTFNTVDVSANNLTGGGSFSITNNSGGELQSTLAIAGDIDSDISVSNSFTNSDYTDTDSYNSRVDISASNLTGSMNVMNTASQGNALINVAIDGNISGDSVDSIMIQNQGSVTSLTPGGAFLDFSARNLTTGNMSVMNNPMYGNSHAKIAIAGDIHSDNGVMINSSVNGFDMDGNPVSYSSAVDFSARNLVSQNGDGLSVYNYTMYGDVKNNITITGDLVSPGGRGISLYSPMDNNTATATVDVNNVTADGDAVYVQSGVSNSTSGLSVVDVTTRGQVVSQQGYGVYLENRNAGETYLTVAGSVQGGNGIAAGLYHTGSGQKSTTLELQPGYAFEGAVQALFNDSDNVDLNSATLSLPDSHLMLGGTAGDAEFDLTRIDNREAAITAGDPNRITGFGTLTKTGGECLDADRHKSDQ
ncbi:hypothetical protein [Citrobacter braakii]|uniref:hypothetical protein n=1 Tax=Citrobacter braakii TaxID=57706 RepID=UPI004039C11B